MPRAATTSDSFNAIAEPRRREIVELLARRGEWMRAANSYRTALRVKPQFGRAHLGLGTALAAMRIDLSRVE